MRARALLLALPLLTAATVAQARLGEPSNRIEARYGPPTKIENGDSSRVYSCHYSHDGIDIVVDYLDDKSACEHFVKKGAPFEDDEIQHLLEINGRGTKWTKVESKDKDKDKDKADVTKWRLSSGVVATYDKAQSSFDIVAHWWQDYCTLREHAKPGEKKFEKLKDF
jgi:hypothetical protein